MVKQCLNLFQQPDSNGQMLIPAILDVFSKVDSEYPKELPELHNDYFLALDEIDIKKKYSPNINY